MHKTIITKNTKVDWTPVGKEYTKDKEDSFVKKFTNCEWKEISPEGNTEAMMPAMGISEAIEQLNIPKVSHYAISNECAPLGLYGVRGHYKNADVDIFLVDAGSSISPVAMVVEERG